MGFVALVVLPIGLTVGAVAWTIFRKGGITGFLFSIILATLGALFGNFAAVSIAGAGPSGGGIGALFGALIAGTLETILRWRTPRSASDPTARHGVSSPIDDPPVDGPRGRMRPGQVRGSEA